MTEPLTDIRTAYFPADDDGHPDSWQVQAGEYADEPDLVILIEHAVDSEGRDIREQVARKVAGALTETAPYVSDSPLQDRIAAEERAARIAETAPEEGT